MSDELYRLVIDGNEVEASPDASIIQAYARAGAAITANVGCMGQGVCGSCRIRIRRPSLPLRGRSHAAAHRMPCRDIERKA